MGKLKLVSTFGNKTNRNKRNNIQEKKQEIDNIPHLKDILTEGFNLYLKSAVEKYKEVGELSLII